MKTGWTRVFIKKEFRQNILVYALLIASFTVAKKWHSYSQDFSSLTAKIVSCSEPDLQSSGQGPITVRPDADVPKVRKESDGMVKQGGVLLPARNITSSSDTLRLTMSSYGGDVVQAELLNDPQTINSPEPIELLNTSEDYLYQAQSGLIGIDGPDSRNVGRPYYEANNSEYSLQPNADSVSAESTFTNADGVRLSKIFHLKRGECLLSVEHKTLFFARHQAAFRTV